MNPHAENGRRARQALRALADYTDLSVDLPGSDDFLATNLDERRDAIETYAGDMIANLMHLCRMEGVDFDEVLRRGRTHFEAETEEETWNESDGGPTAT